MLDLDVRTSDANGMAPYRRAPANALVRASAVRYRGGCKHGFSALNYLHAGRGVERPRKEEEPGVGGRCNVDQAMLWMICNWGVLLY